MTGGGATAPTSSPGRYANIHLDAVRGLAALEVVAYHVRYAFFLDYSQAPGHGVGAQIFYIATSFGHDAVMVFFVLSGYLISGSILRDVSARRWSWGRYILNRLTRLYVVLVPGLLLTLFWDRLGSSLFPSHPVYTGAHQSWVNDFFAVADRSTAAVFVSNLGFLQSISVPPFGSDVPLWSLAYEFGYYAMFPAVVLVFWPSSKWWMRGIWAIAALALGRHFGLTILSYFPIWLLGTGLCIAPALNILKRRDPTWLNVVVGTAAVLGIALTHTSVVRAFTGGSKLGDDYITGIIFAGALYVLLHDRRLAPSADARSWYAWLAAAAAGMSYTLYVVHLPVIYFLRALLVKGTPWSVSPGACLAAFFVWLLVVAYAAAVARLTEARTGAIRAAVGRWSVVAGERIRPRPAESAPRADIARKSLGF